MTPEEAALAAVLDALDRLSIPYMLTGSVAASYHGRPRSTHDADIVIDPTPGGPRRAGHASDGRGVLRQP